MLTSGQLRVWSPFSLKVLRGYSQGGLGQLELGVLVCLCAGSHVCSGCVWIRESVLFPCALPKEQKGLFAVPSARRVTMNPTLVVIPLQFLIPSSG